MSRQEVYNDIKETFGEVPSFFDRVPDDVLEHEWFLLKRIQIEEGVIPGKYRELIGLAVSAALGSDEGVYLSEKGARLSGATDEEIAYAVHFAASLINWTMINRGLQVPADEFKRFIDRCYDYMTQHAPTKEQELRRAA